MALDTSGKEKRICKTVEAILEAMSKRADKTLQYHLPTVPLSPIVMKKEQNQKGRMHKRYLHDGSMPADTRTIVRWIEDVARLGRALNITGAYAMRRGFAVDTKAMKDIEQVGEQSAFGLGHAEKTRTSGVTAGYTFARATNVNRQREENEIAGESNAAHEQTMADRGPSIEVQQMLSSSQVKFYDTIVSSEPINPLETLVWQKASRALTQALRRVWTR